MNFPTVIDQARYISTTGKMIRDRVLQIQSAHLASRGDECSFGDLSLKQIQVVLLVGKHQSVSIKELSAMLSVSPPSASTMVDRLVERGILLRETSPEDRRRVVICVSPSAREEIDAMEEVLLNTFVHLVKRIGPATAGKWCEVLSVVKSALEEDLSALLLGNHEE